MDSPSESRLPSAGAPKSRASRSRMRTPSDDELVEAARRSEIAATSSKCGPFSIAIDRARELFEGAHDRHARGVGARLVQRVSNLRVAVSEFDAQQHRVLPVFGEARQCALIAFELFH